MTFVTPQGEEIKVNAAAGDSLLDLAHEHDIDLEGGMKIIIKYCF